jgi:putative flippase GtrA
MRARSSAAALRERIERVVGGTNGVGAESCRYSVVSVLALGCDLVIYTALLQLGSVPTAAGATGYIAGLCLHYCLSTSWVFPDPVGKRRAIPTFAKFAATGLLGVATTAAIIGALTASGLAGAFAAKAAAVGVTYVAVFLLRRGFVFAGASARAISVQSPSRR